MEFIVGCLEHLFYVIYQLKKKKTLLQKEMLLLQNDVPQWISSIKKYIKVELKTFLHQPMTLLF